MIMDARGFTCRQPLIAACAALIAAPLLALAEADVALQKTVDVAVPGPGQPVQFTVRARNIGPAAATSVLVNDPLPSGLVTPAGAGVYVSAGDYDPVTGVWSMAQLAAGTEATLVMPAVVAMAAPPACLVNVAENATQDDVEDRNDHAAAAVKQDAAVHCVDLVAEFKGVTMMPPVCSVSRNFDFLVEVSNRGPDTARDVIVDLEQSPPLAPGLHFVGSHCNGTRCRFDSIAAGSTVLLSVQSSPFTNTQSRNLRFTLAASTGDVDYATANNQEYVDYVVTPFVPCDGLDDSAYALTGSCFIATAAYGSPLERHVVVLRDFRDRYLRRTAAGRAFIRWYYEHSPAFARFIDERPWARAVTRALLAPVVGAIVTPWRTLAAVLLLLATTLAWRRTRAAT